MPIRLRRNRRDPFWEMDGPAARREHSRSRLMTLIAFSYSVVAASSAVIAWGIQLGIAHVHGIRLLIIR